MAFYIDYQQFTRSYFLLAAIKQEFLKKNGKKSFSQISDLIFSQSSPIRHTNLHQIFEPMLL